MSASPARIWRRHLPAGSPAVPSMSTEGQILSPDRSLGDCIAVLNSGSSSIKFAIYPGGNTSPRLRGQVGAIGVKPELKIRDAAGETVLERSWPADSFGHEAATNAIFEAALGLLGNERVTAVGHRVVHGGTAYDGPVRVDEAVLAALDRLVPLAPLHQPHNLAPIPTIPAHAPHLPQVACFDTAFHRRQAPVVQNFALPRRFQEMGVRRYGFHGL